MLPAPATISLVTSHPRRRSVLLLPILLLLFLPACGQVYQREDIEQKPNVPLTDYIDVFLWTEYLDEEVVARFERSTGIGIRTSHYSTNDELLQRLEAGEKYDLIMPSDYLARHLILHDRLAPLNLANIPNLKFLDPGLAAIDFDPQRRFTVPYYRGVLGIAYDSLAFKIPLHWSDFFTITNDLSHPWKGRLGLVNESRFALSTVLIYLQAAQTPNDPQAIREAANSSDPEAIRAAGQVISNLLPYVHSLGETNIYSDLATGATAMGMAWGAEVGLAISLNSNIRLSVPEEGALKFLDSFAIPADSQKKELAERFIDFLLIPEMTARNVNYAGYATTSDGARPFVRPEILNGPAYIRPSPEESFYLLDVGDEAEAIYDETWNKVLAAWHALQNQPARDN